MTELTSLRPAHVAGRTLAELCARLAVPLPPAADPATRLTGATLDSRAVRRGDLYAGLRGQRAHGADFAGQAAASGAAAMLTDDEGAGRAAGCGLPVVVVEDPRGRLGSLAAWLYGDPAEHLLLLGVTGTNGKTTTTYLVDAALRAAGHTTGLIGTVETRVGDRRVASVRTTPEAPDLHALLALMREEGVTACAMEVSSHALALHRVDGVVFDVAGFTNLSQDHLDFHGTLDAYFAAKAQLFTPAHSRRGVVCVDDEWGRRLAAQAEVPVVPLSVAGRGAGGDGAADGDSGAGGDGAAEGHRGAGGDGAADGHRGAGGDWQVADSRVEHDGRTSFTLRSAAGRALRATCPLPGDFNVVNSALALVMLLEAGVDADSAVQGLAASAPVPGRMERVDVRHEPRETSGVVPGPAPLGVVDYAHTPRAVEAALAALRPATSGLLVIVLGAGGDRDAGKREAMGAAAAGLADVVVVTDDNPRSEAPAAIRAAVLAGARRAAARSGAEVFEVPDRREAVQEAVRAAGRPGSTVLVAGKGHEQGQEVAGHVHPFDDREVLREALARLLG